jgi:branched-chain amino acid aminotransferase
MHRFILHNDEICDAGAKVLCPGQVGVLAGWGVFSTLKVTGGVLFAFERHWSRMTKDAALFRVPFPSDPEYLRQRLLELVRANQVSEATLRVAVIRNRGGIWEGPGNTRDFDLVGLLTTLKTWGKGVKLTVQPQARHTGCGFAGTKILSWSMNLAWLEQAQGKGFDEVILLNERGEVSECTSANIFAVEGTKVWTPPLESGCLPGVTREILLEEIRVPGIEVGEKPLLPADLERASEVFITSTTRDLLPVVSVEGLRIGAPGLIHAALQEAFRGYTAHYLAERAGADGGS